jgi:hypothetical protein
LHDGAEGRLRALQADIQASADARRKVLDELRRTAAELDEFAAGAINRFHGGAAHETQPEPPTETIPPKTEPRPSRGDEADPETRARITPRKPADGAPTSAQGAAADADRSAQPGAGRRKG